MKIAISGKGGSGKTTIAGTLARIMVREGMPNVLAIDGDSNPNLAITLGIPREQTSNLVGMPSTLVKRVTDEEGGTRRILTKPPDEIINEYGIKTPDGVTLLVMGTVDHAGAG